MAKLILIFTGNDSNFFCKIISRVTNGKFTHVAVRFEYDDGHKVLYEAFASRLESDPFAGVWSHSPDRYDKYKSVKFVDVEVPDFAAAEKEARDLLGAFYAYS